MGFRWYFALDEKHYETYGKKKGAVVCPSPGDLRELLRRGEKFDVVAPYLPPEEFRSLFVVVDLPNEGGVFTSQELSYLGTLPPELRKREERRILQERAGLRIVRPKVDEKRLVGLRNVRRFVLQLKEETDSRLRPKAVFLAGLPGTGKSFSAKYAASVLGWYLVELNLTKILESPNPSFVLHSVFSYLESLSEKGQKFVLWIDEIEKVFVGEDPREKRLMGQLLTIMNDLNTPEGYRVEGLIWATANDISAIVERNPEFLRKGRFDELFFVDSPTVEDAKRLFEVYGEHYGVDYGERLPEDGVFYAEVLYRDRIMRAGAENRFIYVPSEVEQICKSLALRQRYNEKFLKGERHLAELLFPPSVLSALSSELGKRGVRPDWKEVAKLHERTLRERGRLLSELDLMAVLAQMEPLLLSFEHALSRIRSNEKFFVKAD